MNVRESQCVSVAKQLIQHFLENSAKRHPDKVAVIHEENRLTYRQVNEAADGMAAFLHGRGVGLGDRVVLLMENSCEYVIAYYGILKAGAVAVPLSTDLKPKGLNPLLAELEPAAMIASSRFERLLQASDLSISNLNTLIIQNPKLDWNPSGKKIVSFDTTLKSGNICTIQIEDSNCANIIYTSGSTGKPKGVMLSHANIVANVNSICDYLKLTADDIQMVVLPFFYVMGKSLLNTTIAAGGHIGDQ